MNPKILELDAFIHRGTALRAQGRILGLCHGVFDLLHPGHVAHLQEAAAQVDHLFVTLTDDPYVDKGPDRPAFPADLRAEQLAALACVDAVAVNPAATAVDLIARLRPHLFIKGGEFREGEDVTGHLQREREAVEACGGRIHFTGGPVFSSSALLNRHLPTHPPGLEPWLEALREAPGLDGLLAALEDLAGLRVLVVGETIIDEYRHCSPLGQAGKSALVAMREERVERHAGGACALANHLAGCGVATTLATVLGEEAETLVAAQLNSAVECVTWPAAGHRGISKRRYLDAAGHKLFEVYVGNEARAADPDGFAAWLEGEAPGFDLVVAADFGHGLIGPRLARGLPRWARLFAATAQVNAGNRGYHFITRYPRADFVALNEAELRLALREPEVPLDELMRTLTRHLDCRCLAVTRGAKGLHFLSGDAAPGDLPALTRRASDPVGAGDALLALSAAGFAVGLDALPALFMGAAAAALAVQETGNRRPVDKGRLAKYLTSLLK